MIDLPKSMPQSLLSAIKLIAVSFSAIFIVKVIIDHQQQLTSLKLNSISQFSLVIFTSLILYLVLIMLLSLAWALLLNHDDKKTHMIIHIKSQIYKYLPGNFFHFLYRHHESKINGVKHGLIIKATLRESIVLIVTAILVFSTLYQVDNSDQIFINLPVDTLRVIVILIYVSFFVNYFHRKVMVQPFIVFGIALSYFLIMGGICYGISICIDQAQFSYIQITAIFSISWLAGYLIPGAPGGLGVRESIFILMSAPFAHEIEALSIIIVLRLITLTSEFIAYLSVNYLNRRLT